MDSVWSSSSSIELSDDKEVEDADWMGESKGVGAEEFAEEEVEVTVRRVTGLCLVAEVAILSCGRGDNTNEDLESLPGRGNNRYASSQLAVGRRGFCWELQNAK